MPGNAVFLVTGPSAAGKSTVGRLLAERLTPGAYLEGKETPRIGLWLDSSEQTPQQTVDEILARSDEALVPA